MVALNEISQTERIRQLEQENAELRKQLDEANDQLHQQTRLVAAGESAAITAHEALNPLTSVITRLQDFLNEESDFYLIKLILEAWNQEYTKGGINQLVSSLSEKVEGSEKLMVEEDLSNLQNTFDETYQDLDFLLFQLKRTVMIINNLRELARTDTALAPCDVKTSLKMTVQLMKDSLKKRNIQMVTQFNHSAQVMADDSELTQVFHNLARNGMQAIGKDGTLTFSTSQNAQYLEIRIIDTGPGVPAEHVDKIFDNRFTTKSKKDGTGLGLYFSRKIIEKYQGELVLETPGGNGSGATFLCRLPILQKHA